MRYKEIIGTTIKVGTWSFYSPQKSMWKFGSFQSPLHFVSLIFNKVHEYVVILSYKENPRKRKEIYQKDKQLNRGSFQSPLHFVSLIFNKVHEYVVILSYKKYPRKRKEIYQKDNN